MSSDSCFAANTAGHPLSDVATTECSEALAALQAYVFRDGEATVPGGVRGKSTPSRARSEVSGGVIAELRLMREEMAAGFASVVAALTAQQ